MTSEPNSIRERISNDKRKCERLDLDIRIMYSLAQERNAADLWEGPFEIDNICGDGLSLGCNKQLERNTELHIKIHLCEESDPIHCYGKIVWCRERSSSNCVTDLVSEPNYALGVQFDEVHEADKKRFVSYISDQILYKYMDA